VYALRLNGRLLALARRAGPNLQPFRVFALEDADALLPEKTEEASAA
jgi:hypothetical protein